MANEQQAHEIEALSSIYGDKWKRENESGTSFSIEIDKQTILFITMNEMYPSKCRPTYELQAPHLSKEDKTKIFQVFNDIYLQEIIKYGDKPVIYDWIETLKEILSEKNENKRKNSAVPDEKVKEINQKIPDFTIFHGDTITDRRSSFQGHACKVKSKTEVKLAMDQLLRNNKIAQATHNILAYRIQHGNVVLEDCNDDGEAGASSRVLHLLHILNVNNVMVVVTRWRGNPLLGPDRFKHINNAARNALVKADVIPK